MNLNSLLLDYSRSQLFTNESSKSHIYLERMVSKLVQVGIQFYANAILLKLECLFCTVNELMI